MVMSFFLGTLKIDYWLAGLFLSPHLIGYPMHMPISRHTASVLHLCSSPIWGMEIASGLLPPMVSLSLPLFIAHKVC
jgi:hypothetical protein